MRPANWLQLVRFGLVGGIGFVVNLAVFALLEHGFGVEYVFASVAWLVAVLNNFRAQPPLDFDARAGSLSGDSLPRGQRRGRGIQPAAA